MEFALIVPAFLYSAVRQIRILVISSAEEQSYAAMLHTLSRIGETMSEIPENGTAPTAELLDKIVRQHMIAAFAAGIVPIPVLDIAAMSGVQFNLVRKLSRVYGVPFSQNVVKNIVGGLLGGAVPIYSGPLLAGMVKFVPLVGTTLGIVSLPFVAAGTTYAVGHLFIEHFESGGSLLSFDLEKAKRVFPDLVSRGKAVAGFMKKNGDFSSSQGTGPESWGDAEHDFSEEPMRTGESGSESSADEWSTDTGVSRRRPPDFD